MPDTAGNEFLIHIEFLAPPCSTVVRQRMLCADRSPRIQFRNMEALELLGNHLNLCPLGRQYHNLQEQICPLPQRETLSLSFEAASYINIHEKKEGNKS